MLSVFICFGIITAKLLNSYLWIAVFAVLIAVCCLIASLKCSGLKIILMSAVLFYTIGSYEFIFLNHSYMDRLKNYSDKEVNLKGFINSVPEIKEPRVSYVVKLESIEVEGKENPVKGKIILSLLKQDGDHLIDYGRAIDVKGKLTLPKGMRNPGGFDYRSYLASNGISATMFSTSQNISIRNQYGSNLLEKTGLVIRQKIINVINSSLPLQQAGLLNGMLIGYRGGLDKSVQAAFSDAGLTHIMAVSGANIAFIVLPLIYILRKIKLSNRKANLIVIGVLVIFVYITGFEPSVLRAVIMAVVILTGRIIFRESDIFSSLAFSAILILLFNPMMLFNIGFQLSYGATISIVLFYNNIKDFLNYKFIPAPVVDVLAGTLAAQLGVLPITVYYFNQISVISIISNMLVVPLTQIVTILGFVMAFLGQISIFFSQLIGYVNCSFLSFILYVTKVTAEIPFAVLKVTTPSLPGIIIYYIALVFLLWYRPIFKPFIRLEYYVLAVSISIVIIMLPVFMPKDLEIVFLDVGQGDCAFIRTTGGKTILVDGGGYSSSTNTASTMGETVVIPFLMDYGVGKLDLVVATHGHDDHIQGLLPVLKHMNVEKLVLADNPDKENEFKILFKIAREKRIDVDACKSGDRINLDGKTYFDVLNPQGDYAHNNSPLNNGSLVLKLDYKETEFLFTGDIEEEAEKMLLSKKIDLTSDFLKVAHHGSSTSSTNEFLSAVKAKGAVISVGNNNFGHPSPEVLERMKNQFMQLYRTDRDGGIVVRSDGKNIKIQKTVMVK